MSPASDFLHEMPGEPPLDDRSIESLLDGTTPPDAELGLLVSFTEEVRFAVSGPPPAPSGELAAVLAVGFSTDKGDLLATAASNVHGPAPQVAGLPMWRKVTNMPVTNVPSGILSRLTGLGAVAKTLIASVTAATTITLAGGAAGILPAPAQHLVAATVGAASPFEFPDPSAVTHTVEQAVAPLAPSTSAAATSAAGTPALPPASVAGSGSTAANPAAPAKVPALASSPTIPAVNPPSLPPITVPPAVTNLTKGLPGCVTNLIPTAGSVPDPARLASQIPGCIQQVLASASLPVDVAKCLSSVLGTIGGVAGMKPGSVPGVGSVSSCVPLDVSKCISNALGSVGNLPVGGLPGLGSLPGVPGLSGVAGCVPMDVGKCLTSIVGSLSALPGSTTGAAPKLDLSACMPTATGGLGGGIPGLGGGIPGLSGALPFMGR